jgi:AAA+ superfamily predicted ATPase
MTSDDALIRALRAAIAATPDEVALRQHLGDLLMETGAFDDAVTAYREALDRAPDDTALQLSLARAYAGAGRDDVALVVLEQLLRQCAAQGTAPPAPALVQAARAYLEAGDPARAASLYRQGVAQDAALADAELAARLPEEAPAPSTPSEDAPVPVLVEQRGDWSADVEQPVLTFEDVGGMDALKEEIRMKIIYPLAHPELYKAYGKAPGGGILMYGPPGCGKTYLARATAGEVQAAFLAVGLHDVLDMFLGNSEQNLHRTFDLARQHAPCVLFFDEVDALGAKRSDMRYSGIRQVINQLLYELDGVADSNVGVLVLAATNAPWHLDDALRRPGRFDRVLFVPPPDAAARAAILRLMLADKPAGAVDAARLAQHTEGFSGADLRGLVDAAVERKLREAMQQGAPVPLTTQDLLGVVKSIRPSTQEWFETARNYALYANQGGAYDDVLAYMKAQGRGRWRL